MAFAYTVGDLIAELSQYPNDAKVLLEYGRNAMTRRPVPKYKMGHMSPYCFILPDDIYGAPRNDEPESEMVVFL